MRRPRGFGATTMAGYGGAHQKARAQAIRDMVDGQLCTRCHQPMFRSEIKSLHLDHSDDRSGYLGLAHQACNTRAGQAKSMLGRRRLPAQTHRSRQW